MSERGCRGVLCMAWECPSQTGEGVTPAGGRKIPAKEKGNSPPLHMQQIFGVYKLLLLLKSKCS